MSRYPVKSSLPPLEEVFPDGAPLEKHRPKKLQVAEYLEAAILRYPSTRNRNFYTTRDVSRYFKISQNTANLAVLELEKKGLVRRVRGSHTMILGTQIVTRANIHAVAGMMMWRFAQIHSEVHGRLTRSLGEELWPHHIALEVIAHFDLGEKRADLNDILRKHLMDFAIWPFPFGHHRDSMLRLEDRGVRNLIIGVDGIQSSYEAQIVVDFKSAYRELLEYWRNEHEIERILVVNPREFIPRKRLSQFRRLAEEMGFDCSLEESGYELPATLLEREKKRVGIALLDEHSTAEFTFYNPAAFVELARRHRILFGTGSVNIPFVPHGELRVERIYPPTNPEAQCEGTPLIPAIANTLSHWCAHEYDFPRQVVRAILWKNGEIWRYL